MVNSMYKFPIGAIIESFRLPTLEAVKKAAELKLDGLQMYATSGEHAPENLSGKKAKELLEYVKDSGLRFSALCGDLGHGFGDKELNPSLIEKSKRILDLSKELECDIVTTHIGVVPESPEHERYKIMQAACAELAEYADSVDAHFAIETGPETSATLKKFLDSLGSRGVGVNLDPANLVMVTGDDPVKAVHNLKDYIVHTHAKDGKMLAKGNPEYIVTASFTRFRSSSRVSGISRRCRSEPDRSTSRRISRLFDEIGYKGYLTIEREVGDTPAKDIATAADFLREIINK